MDTPIYDFLKSYQASGFSRLHMPGHKGQPYLGCEGLDITEIQGADELYDPEGIIAQSEQNAAALFGTGITAYSVEGSSHCIRSMLLLAKQLFFRGEGRPKVLAARNAHKAFLYAAALWDLDVDWIYPEERKENSVAACQISPEQLETALERRRAEDRMPFAVYVTSPDYLGQLTDIQSMAEIAHRFGAALLVDNAHGAYLHFLPEKLHPMDLGADLCCDSAHKTLPVLTGGAYLHVRKGLTDSTCVKTAMEVTGTTSPSYLIMASLDLCNRQMEQSPQSLPPLIARIDRWKEAMTASGIPILPSEPLKIVVHAAAMGFTGGELGDVLRRHQCEPEFCDADYLVAMLTPDTKSLDLERFADALLDATKEKRPPRASCALRLLPLQRELSIRQAVLAPHETVSLSDAVGRICGSPTVSCPPAIPIAVSGERITAELLPILETYGIHQVTVVAGNTL